MEQQTGIAIAVERAGGQRMLAELLSSTVPGYDCPSQQAISLWVRQGYVPQKRVLEVARATGVDPKSLMAPALREMLAASSDDKVD